MTAIAALRIDAWVLPCVEDLQSILKYSGKDPRSNFCNIDAPLTIELAGLSGTRQQQLVSAKYGFPKKFRTNEMRFPLSVQSCIAKIIKFVDAMQNWHCISTAPFNRDLQLCVLEGNRKYLVPFPCRLTRNGWLNSDLDVRLDLNPIEWRCWPEGVRPRPV